MLATLTSRLEELRKAGYTCNFAVEDGKLASPDKEGISCKPSEVKIQKIYRFEGESNPADLSILYALETSEGDKGLLVDGYGAYNSEEVAGFMRQVPQ